RALAGRLDTAGPVQRASRRPFDAEAGADPAAVAGGGQALPRWDAAAAAWDRVARPYELATALLRAAEAAMAAGDRDGATRRLRHAAELAGARPAPPPAGGGRGRAPGAR